MITRLVRLSIRPEETDRFLDEFRRSEALIRSFEGCSELRLYRESGENGVFFTWSRWSNVAALEVYRNSALFLSTWSRVKPLFSEPAQAWTLTEF